MLSIIIPTYNESSVLARAMKAILAVRPECEHEFIVIDDRSTDDTPKILNSFLGLRIVRPDKRGGTSSGRRLGAEVAKGDVLCFIDAHVWPDPGFFDLLNETCLSHPDSIVSPGLTQHTIKGDWIALPEKRKATNYGGGFQFAVKKFWFYMSVNKHPKRWQQRRGAYACGMTMTRELYDYLDGWMRLPGYWSSSDVAMCIKCWYLDVPIMIETKTQHYHGVKGFGPHETPKWHEVINRLYATRVLFSPECYNDLWYPAFKRNYSRHWTKDFDTILNSPVIQAEHETFRRRIKHDDEEFLEAFVYPRLRRAQEAGLYPK